MINEEKRMRGDVEEHRHMGAEFWHPVKTERFFHGINSSHEVERQRNTIWVAMMRRM